MTYRGDYECTILIWKMSGATYADQATENLLRALQGILGDAEDRSTNDGYAETAGELRKRDVVTLASDAVLTSWSLRIRVSVDDVDRRDTDAAYHAFEDAWYDALCSAFGDCGYGVELVPGIDEPSSELIPCRGERPI